MNSISLGQALVITFALVVIASLAVVVGSLLFKRKDILRQFLTFFAVGLICSLVPFLTFGLFFGFIPVLLNSVVLTAVFARRGT